jgi:GTPase SAR1 family protein
MNKDLFASTIVQFLQCTEIYISLTSYHIDKLEYNRATEKLFKVIIIGDPGVGKTSFIRRYVQNAFRGDYKATIGVDFALKIVRWSENQTIKLQLWDIAGNNY